MDQTEEREPTPEEEVLFPARYSRLLSGELVLVEPWGIERGKMLNPRCMALMSELNGDFDMATVGRLVVQHQDEVVEIVRLTIGWSVDEMKDEKRIRYEDIFTLAQSVIEVCIVRGQDFGGIVGKAVALGVLAWNQQSEANASSPQSSSSSQTDTPGATSTVTPPSK